jgi:cytoskeletal protein CcmA (bactofilin family)
VGLLLPFRVVPTGVEFPSLLQMIPATLEELLRAPRELPREFFPSYLLFLANEHAGTLSTSMRQPSAAEAAPRGHAEPGVGVTPDTARPASTASVGRSTPHAGVISIIGAGMRVMGDCETEGTLRVEGIVQGTVRAGQAVVVGKGGVIDGDVFTQDAIVGGRIRGTIIAGSRLELQATGFVEGDIHARRIQLDEGARIDATIRMGEISSAIRTPLDVDLPAEAPHGELPI